MFTVHVTMLDCAKLLKAFLSICEPCPVIWGCQNVFCTIWWKWFL